MVKFLEGLSPMGQWQKDMATGLGSGLNQLIQGKMRSMTNQGQQVKNASALEALGYGPDEAKALSGFDNPDILKEIVRGKVAGSGISNKDEVAQRKLLEPQLKLLAEDQKNAGHLYKIASEMKQNLIKNKDKWPTFSGHLSEKFQKIFQRDEDIRKYMADSNKLVSAVAHSRKGQPTNFKIKLEQSAKPELNQPYGTQLALINSILEESEGVFKTADRYNDIRKQYGGKLPLDLREQLNEGNLQDVLSSYGQSSEFAPSQQQQAQGQQQQAQSPNAFREESTGNVYIIDPETNEKIYLEEK